MTARVLIVDDLLPNIKVLEARLTAEYFTVLSAMNGPQGLDICARGECDIVLLDVMMPGMDGFEVCKRLKAAPETAHLPVVLVTALDQPADRLRGLEAGADDFLTKPINEMALLTRVRSLLRLKNLTDELRTRVLQSPGLGLPDPLMAAAKEDGRSGQILLLEDRANNASRMAQSLAAQHKVDVEGNVALMPSRMVEGDYDLIIVSLGLAETDALRLVAHARSNEKTRNTPILVMAEATEEARVQRALQMDVNDYLIRPIDRNELLARVSTQIRKKRYQARLRENLQASMELAIIDPLTKLHNRRYFQTQLDAMLGDSRGRTSSVSLLVIDVDHFKRINDTYGHDGGDDVLRETAERLRKVIRSIDVVARFGGEEFVILMPHTDVYSAQHVAERVRRSFEQTPFMLHGGKQSVTITASIGVASAGEGFHNSDMLFQNADKALYAAKQGGRNRVMLAQAA